MTIHIGNSITATSYNSIVNSVNSVLGTYYGYPLASSAVTSGNVVTANDWNNLYSDINKTLIHQSGRGITFGNITTGTRLTSSFANSLTNLAQTINDHKPDVYYQTQVILDQATNSTRTATWGSPIVLKVQYTWRDGDHARYFFNQGGYIVATCQYNLAQSALQNTTDIAWQQFISAFSSLTSFFPSAVAYDANNYTSSFTPYIANPPQGSILPSGSSISVTYAKLADNVVEATMTFTPVGDGLSIGAYPIAGFKDYYSNGSITTATPDIHVISYLSLSGSSVYGLLDYQSVPPITIHQYNTSSVTVRLVNHGAGTCTINSISFVDPSNNLSVSGSINAVPNTLAPNNASSSVINFIVNTGSAPQGEYQEAYLLITSDSIGGDLIVPLHIIVNYPVFQVQVSPTSVTHTLTTGTPVTQYFSYTSGLTGNIASVNLSQTDTTHYSVSSATNITGIEFVSGGFFGGLIPEIISNSGNIISKFTPPGLTQIGTITGAYPDTITATFVPSDTNQSSVTKTIPISYTLNIQNQNLGTWISSLDRTNAVAGFSYDIIDGVKYLTIGFGMGADGSVPLQNGGGVFASVKSLSIGQDSNPSSGIVLYPSTDPQNQYDFCSFLKTYGAWFSGDGGRGFGGTIDTNKAPYSFFVPAAGTYYYEISVSGSADLYINGVRVATWSDSTSSYKGAVNLNAGVNTCSFVMTSNTTGAVYPYDTNNSNASSANLQLTSPEWSNPSGGIATSYGNSSIGISICDDNNNLYWSTLTPQRVAYKYWTEAYRIPLVDASPGNPKVYLNGDYPIKLTDHALGNTHSSYCGTGANAGSMFVVIDDGHGNLTISMNPYQGTGTNNSQLDLTLGLSVALPFYFSNIGTRITNIGAATGSNTKFFLGFNNNGAVRTCQLPYPYIITSTVNGKKSVSVQNIAVALGLVAAVTLPGVGALVASGLAYLGFASAASIVAAGSAGVVGVGLTAAGEVAAYEGGASFLSTALTAWAEAGFPTCFTEDTLVDMADGLQKRIVDVKEGDLVFNHDRTSINRVTFLEYYQDNNGLLLYSPTEDLKPFATVCHPLIINGEMYSVDPDNNYEIYPWLGLTKKFNTTIIAPVNGKVVYNLWVDGDGTYTANGYGTTSIIGDGGLLKLGLKHGFINQEKVTELFKDFKTEGTEMSYGGYLINKILGKVNIKLITKLAIGLFMKPKDSKIRVIIYKITKFIGKIAIKVTNLRG